MSEFVFWSSACILVVLPLYLAISRIVEHNYSKRLKFKQALKKIEEADRVFYNSKNGVIAICSKCSLMKASKKFEEEITRNPPKKAEKIVYFVFPTFTFADGQFYRRIHSGGKIDLEDLLEEIIFKRTGICCREFTQKQLEFLKQILLRHEHKLFVPYSGDFPSPAKQYEMFGEAYINEMREEFGLDSY